jgi:hypothetical protein
MFTQSAIRTMKSVEQPVLFYGELLPSGTMVIVKFVERMTTGL